MTDTQKNDKTATKEVLELLGITYTTVRENWIHRERKTQTDELIYLNCGNLFISVNDEKYELVEGTFFFIPKFSSLSGYKPSSGVCSFYTLSYESNIKKLSEAALLPITTGKDHVFTDELVKRISNCDTGSDKSRVLLSALMYEIFENDPCKDTKPLMQKAVDYINQNLGNPLSVDVVCDYLKYNRDYVSKQFLSCYGITMKKYIDNKRVALSKQLLLTSNMSLNQIAEAVGFENTQQFYKFFKYHEKLSPSDFRDGAE